VESDFDLADLRQPQFVAGETESYLRKSEALVPIGSFKAMVTGRISIFHAPEECREGQIDPLEHLLISTFVLTSLFTLFFIGLVVGLHYTHLLKNLAWRLTGKTNRLNYCELVQNKELFHNTTVRLHARIGADSTTEIFLYGCKTGIEANLTRLILED
jgi:hypothetical protein